MTESDLSFQSNRGTGNLEVIKGPVISNDPDIFSRERRNLKETLERSITFNGIMKSHKYYVYILTNKNNKVIYVGMTNNLTRRIYEHKNKLVDGYTKKYNIDKLVYFEETSEVKEAIRREKEIKKWRREKKNRLVETNNPEWKDLSKEYDMEI